MVLCLYCVNGSHHLSQFPVYCFSPVIKYKVNYLAADAWSQVPTCVPQTWAATDSNVLTKAKYMLSVQLRYLTSNKMQIYWIIQLWSSATALCLCVCIVSSGLFVFSFCIMVMRLESWEAEDPYHILHNHHAKNSFKYKFDFYWAWVYNIMIVISMSFNNLS